MKRYSKKQRHDIYTEGLKYFRENSMETGRGIPMCLAIYKGAGIDVGCNKSDFFEIFLFKRKNMFPYWFLDFDCAHCYKMRETCLMFCVEMTK